MVKTTQERLSNDTPRELATAPGYIARRLYQSYAALWVRRVDATLTGPQFAVLTAVRTTPGVDQRSLAASIALDTSTMADICRRLEKRDLIRRETSPTDARRKLLVLTEAGEATLDEVKGRSLALNARLLDGIPSTQRTVMIQQMMELADHWESMSAD